MNIQIFGKNKCFDTKKAERYFKERRVKYQFIDLPRYGISQRELESIVRAVGGLDKLIDEKHPGEAGLAYLAYEEAKLRTVLDDPTLLKTPLVRNGRQATVGYCPDFWKEWE
jgi:arsenate reductase